MEGKIKRVNNGFFFIQSGGKDYFCHNTSYNDRTPEVGDLVEFEEQESDKGLKAVNARLIQKGITDNIAVKDSESLIRSNILNDYFVELKSGYFNDKGNLKESFIIDFPEKLAIEFSKDKSKNKPAQISKFYYEFKKYESIYKINKDFDNIKTDLLKIIPLAEKSKERLHLSEGFNKFISENIKLAIQSENNFSKGFIPHFQSLMGYFKN
jgi:cold shock CspA family protein